MSELWMNKYKPKTLDDYVGDQYTTILHYLDTFFNGEMGKGFILYGNPGVGKSALISVIGYHYDAEMFVINSSDDRNTINVGAINASSLSGKKRIVIMEESDGFNQQKFKELSKVIETSKNPIILICNDIKLIDNIVKSKCFIKEIVVDRFALKALGKRIIKEEGLDISNDQLNEALKNSKSYRGILDFLQFGSTSETGSFNTKENIKDTIQFTSDNSESPNLISLADIYLQRSQQGYKNGQKIAKYILDNIDIKTSNYPRTYRLIAEARKPKKKTGTMKILGFK